MHAQVHLEKVGKEICQNDDTIIYKWVMNNTKFHLSSFLSFLYVLMNTYFYNQKKISKILFIVFYNINVNLKRKLYYHNPTAWMQ